MNEQNEYVTKEVEMLKKQKNKFYACKVSVFQVILDYIMYIMNSMLQRPWPLLGYYKE